MAHGNRLSGLDTSFLHLETGPAHMHVASTTLFEGPAPEYEEFRDHIASRLHLVPRFRQKLRFVPFGQGRPVWVDDPNLNLEYHIRHTALPPPGSEEQVPGAAASGSSASPDSAASRAASGAGSTAAARTASRAAWVTRTWSRTTRSCSSGRCWRPYYAGWFAMSPASRSAPGASTGSLPPTRARRHG